MANKNRLSDKFRQPVFYAKKMEDSIPFQESPNQ